MQRIGDIEIDSEGSATVATWQQLRSYIYQQYQVEYVSPAGQLGISFELSNGRSQRVLISQAIDGSNGEEWAKIESIVGRVGEVDMGILLELIRFQLVGGLAKNDDFVTVRHSVPLADMSAEEFESPLAAVLETADYLEQTASRGADRY